MKNHHKAAHKKATKLYFNEINKPDGFKRLSASRVSELVQEEFGTTIEVRTIQREVKQGRVGVSPKKMGPSSQFPNLVFNHLANAFESYIIINQLNGQGGDVSYKKLIMLLKKCTMSVIGCDCKWLVQRLVKHTAISLSCGQNNNVEERRIRWTTYNNLKTWFDSWERELLDLGFAYRRDDQSVDICIDQLERILNIDETCLVLDGSKCNRGGRPTVTFYSRTLPNVGKGTIKAGQSTTMIGGSTAAGEPIPPHFQFSTTAKSAETERINVQVAAFFQMVRGKFGCTEARTWGVSSAMNEKGGMDDEEFQKYLKGSIYPLYPDAEDVPGKHVMIKVDSGPGHLQINMLADARIRGFYLFPGVPNTTAVTQETDQSYGPFKTQFAKNLKEVSDARINGNHSTSLPPWMVSLMVFGGQDPVSGVVVPSAFEVGFSKERNLSAWKKCGAAPLTRATLKNHKQVRRELGDENDAMNVTMQLIQATNNVSTYFLSQHGYSGNVFKGEIKHVGKTTVTQPYSQERIDAIAKATTHGSLFQKTGGGTICSDEFFWEQHRRMMKKRRHS